MVFHRVKLLVVLIPILDLRLTISRIGKGDFFKLQKLRIYTGFQTAVHDRPRQIARVGVHPLRHLACVQSGEILYWKQAVREGHKKLVGAVFEINSGRVRFFNESRKVSPSSWKGNPSPPVERRLY